MRLANKTALITGGNSGIGLTTAKLFVAEGAKVAITGRDKARLDAAVAELGPNAIGIVADATDIAATENAVAKAVEKFGKLDIVFANAGISAHTPVGGTALDVFESVLKTNITAVKTQSHRDRTATLGISLEVKDVDHLNRIGLAVRRLSDVLDIQRALGGREK